MQMVSILMHSNPDNIIGGGSGEFRVSATYH
jgi:hypothetical protein